MKLRIIVADADQQNADELTAKLDLCDCGHVAVCYSEDDCLAKVRTVRPDVVFMAVAMRGICTMIRAELHPAPVQIVGLLDA